jgi:hypothetical protein
MSAYITLLCLFNCGLCPRLACLLSREQLFAEFAEWLALVRGVEPFKRLIDRAAAESEEGMARDPDFVLLLTVGFGGRVERQWVRKVDLASPTIDSN